MGKLFYSISEVAEQLGESVSCIRFWTNGNPTLVRPLRTAKGNRQYRDSDIEALKRIQILVKKEGHTLEGAARKIAVDSSSVDRKLKALETLRSIRDQLIEIKETL